MRSILLTLLIVLPSLLMAQNSYTLEEAIDYAIENNANMKMAMMDVDRAEASLAEFKSAGLPQVNASVDYNYYFFTPVNPIQDFLTPAIYGVLLEEFPNQVTPPPGEPDILEFTFFNKHNLSANVNGSMLLFDGSYLTGLKAAKLFRELTRKKIDTAEEQVRTQVTKAYMNILIAEENENILSKNLKNIDASLTQAQAFYETGFMESLDVDRVALSKKTVETELEKIKAFIDVTYDLLKFQMNYPLSQDLSISEDLESLVSLISAEVDTDYADIDYNRKAQYEEIRMGRQLNELNVERFEKGYLPSVMARAGVTEQLQRNNLFDSNEAGWLPTVFAGLSVNVPITDGKRKKSLIQQAEIDLKKIDVQLAEFERGMDMQVQNSLNNFETARKTLLNRKESLDIVQRIYDKTLIKFKEGVGSSLEVTQAENQLFSAQGQYTTALYELLTTKTDLDIALGKL